MAESPRNVDGLGLDELKTLCVQALEDFARLKAESEARCEEFAREVARLTAENEALREEVTRLKGLKGRPKLKPSGMEQSHGKRKRKVGRRGAKRSQVRIDETKIIKAENVPAGSRQKGYRSFLFQDLMVQSRTVLFQRERWQTPSGDTIMAPLPPGVVGHFGPELKRLVLALYHQGQTTAPRLCALLNGLGLSISKRQLMRLLNERHSVFHQEAQETLRAGLARAPWITVDDTGARHKMQNGVCTHIGNDHFAWFATTRSKNRLNFLDHLAAGDTAHLINAAAIAYMRTRKLPQTTIAVLMAHADKRFADRAAWLAHLQRLAITTLKVRPGLVRIATEGAVWGCLTARGHLKTTVIVSDDAGQFNVGKHALCWVHAERLVHKLDAFSELQRAAKERARKLIWAFYRSLKAYACAPTPARKATLAARFDTIFTTTTGFVTLDRLLKRLHAQKKELLMVLERPEVPLHTNGSENDIRAYVTRRKVSGGTRSDTGRNCRDTFLGLMKTCAKQTIRFWDYLGDRLGVPGAPSVPYLPDLLGPAPEP